MKRTAASISGCCSLAVLTTLCLTSCESKQIHGTVVDAFGKPLDSVAVHIANTAFSTTSRTDGRYAIDFAPGQLRLTWSKPGYTSRTMDVTISEKMPYPVDTTVLYQTPEGRGVFYYAASGQLISLPVGRVRWVSQGPRCEDTVGADVSTSPGRVILISRTSEPIGIRRIGTEGFLERESSYLPSLDTSSSDLQVVAPTLSPGHYAVYRSISTSFYFTQEFCYPFRVLPPS